MMRLEDFLNENCQTQTFPAGTLIALANMQSDAAYYIKKGQVSVFHMLEGEEAVLAKVGPDEIVGEMSILHFDHYTANLRAETDVEAYVITPDIVHNEISKAHPIVKLVVQTLLTRMHDVNETLVHVAQANAMVGE